MITSPDSRFNDAFSNYVRHSEEYSALKNAFQETGDIEEAAEIVQVSLYSFSERELKEIIFNR